MLGDDFVPLKCPKCGITAIKLIKELPITIKIKYPEGLCRKCKRDLIIELRGMLKKWYHILSD